MAFKPEMTQEFLSVFNESKSQIAQFPGCLALSLYQDIHLENVFYTVSIWENENSLENYRNSELFRTTWLKTKILFHEKPLAFSLQLKESVKEMIRIE